MCLIVDTNVAATVFFDVSDETFQPVRFRLLISRKAVKLVYGGRLLQEYRQNLKVMRILVSLDRAAKTNRIDDQKVNAEEERVINEAACRSNDPHIIALARISNARVLVSLDSDLQYDFKYLLKPRGKIYKQPSHKRLLRLCAV